ncbi:LysR substrate-binding domain-containing protein [Paucibacter sp. O1-1]|nr:LysR substrate-binding domain-containing protein [Paucibacter sp. O1-1]MDA3826294.1 LysR substrate-binding domain-containing protein [Paucibacter sp. O1-1]
MNDDPASSASISSRQLQAFVALARLRSFTQAAVHCHLSQPAFSALIQGLETAVGARLFERSTRHVALTVEGQVFERSAAPLLAQLGQALAEVRDHAQLRRGQVSLALLPSLAAGWLPGLLSEFRAAHPGIALQVADVLSEPCLQRVREGQADFAIAAVRADTPELRAEPFASDRFHLVCPLGHELLARPSLKPRDLLPFPFIHLARHSSVRQLLDAAVHPLQLQTLMEVEQLATVMGMVRAGLGLSVVPAFSLFHFRQPELATRELRWRGLADRQLFLVRRRDRELSTAARALYELLLRRRP